MNLKKTLCALLAMFLFFSSQADVITKTYQFNDPAIKQINDYHFLKLNNTLMTGLPGQPALPYASVKLLLPPGHVATSITIEGHNLKVLSENFKAYPYQPSQPISKKEKSVFQKNEAIYNSNEAYPAKAEGKLSTGFYKGHAVAMSSFTPVIYYPSQHIIACYQSVTVTIETTASEEAQQALKMLPSSNKQVAKTPLFDNPEMISAYTYTPSRDENYDYLIITDDEYVADFDVLKAFYLDRGYITQVVTTDAIESAMAGQDLQEKIRNYIIQEYQNHEVEYFLLGGDVEYIPYRGFYCTVESSSTYQDDDIPADLYYSGLDGNWNTDEDGYWAEPDEDDLLPDVSVGRFPFSDHEELENMLNKTMNFQGSPIVGELAKPFLAGENLYDDPETWGSDYLELHIGFHDDNDYETQGIPEDYDIEKLYASEVGTWSGQDIMDVVNTGKSQLYHVGHANTSTVMNLYTSDITNENFYGANGVDHTYTNIYTHGCICGSFDASDCIGETMVKIDNFAASFIGNSRYGWFNEGQTEGPSQHIHREFTDELYGNNNLNIGNAHKVSKRETSPFVEAPGQWEEGALRWCFYDCNVLGDPAMRLWTSEPLDITINNPDAIQIGEADFEVEVTSGGNALENYRCVLKQEGAVLGIGITDENGIATVTIDNGLASVGDAELLVSGNNIQLHTIAMSIIPNEGAYIVLDSYEMNDDNGNGLAENGESISFNITLENVGSENAENVTAVLSTNDAYVTIINNTANFGLIEGESTANVDDAFAIEIQNGIPDQHEITFLITATAGESWTSDFDIIVNAPELAIGDILIDDSEGNNNGVLDPGEEATLTINNLNNGHNAIADLEALLSSASDDITINTSYQTIANLAAQGSETTSFDISVSADAETGTVAAFSYSLSNANYSIDSPFSLSIGIIFDGFETGDYTGMDWMLAGDTPWFICEADSYGGDYCSQSGAISHSQSSEMTLDIEVVSDDEISFYRKVSSESGYDFLRFYIDDDMMDEWSGEESWDLVSYPITQGEHTVKWIYSKDMSAQSGSDCGWIDEIEFPPLSFPTNIENVTAFVNDIQIYPNPASEKIIIRNLGHTLNEVCILNQAGHVVLRKEISNTAATIQIDELPAGMYVLMIKEEETMIRKKFIKIN